MGATAAARIKQCFLSCACLSLVLTGGGVAGRSQKPAALRRDCCLSSERYLLVTELCEASVSVQQCITGLLLVSTLCAAALSHPPHPYTAHSPKRILLQHLVRFNATSQVPQHPSFILWSHTQMQGGSRILDPAITLCGSCERVTNSFFGKLPLCCDLKLGSCSVQSWPCWGLQCDFPPLVTTNALLCNSAALLSDKIGFSCAGNGVSKILMDFTFARDCRNRSRCGD